MSVERNLLERKLSLARKTLREAEAEYALIQHQALAALERCTSAKSALRSIEQEKFTILHLEAGDSPAAFPASWHQE